MMPDYESLGASVGRLVAAKQAAYGNSFSKSGAILRALYPEGIAPEQYDDVLALTRMIDKFFRIANGNQGGEDAWQDLAGYSLLGMARGKRDAEPVGGQEGASEVDRVISPAEVY